MLLHTADRGGRRGGGGGEGGSSGAATQQTEGAQVLLHTADWGSFNTSTPYILLLPHHLNLERRV